MNQQYANLSWWISMDFSNQTNKDDWNSKHEDIMNIYHLVMTNIAMENPNHKWRFIAGKIIYKWAIFHGYVK